jgi:hypothetical protein
VSRLNSIQFSNIVIIVIIIIIINVKFKTLNEKNITCTVHCKYRRAATPDTLESFKYPAKG